MTRFRAAALPLLLLAVLATAGCAGAGSTGSKGYVDGNGVITILPDAERQKPGPVTGKTLDGVDVSLAQYAGKVVVINVWGSWCPPCRKEADDLAKAANELMPSGVVFLGINTRDTSKDNALAFQRSRKVPYPSIYDPGGRNLLAFRGTLSPNAIPSTVVIDKDGRVAASILGEVTSSVTLKDIVEQVAAS
ncbi:MAG: TlpA family protein disulfide reductase [Marmoricola sp.]|nr:TlpA family protein disulfide reductase [Marmoricola sp.]